VFTLFVSGRLPGLNELLNQKATVSGNWNGYNRLKCQWYGQIALLVRARGIQPQPAGFMTFLFLEPTRKRDPDNLVAGGAKLLFDSLVGAEVLPGDGWLHNLGFVGFWEHTPNRAGCLLHWGDELLSKAQMLKLYEELLEKEGKDGTANDGRGTPRDESHRATVRQIGSGHARARRKLGGR
jgi:hypothetical protein